MTLARAVAALVAAGVLVCAALSGCGSSASNLGEVGVYDDGGGFAMTGTAGDATTGLALSIASSSSAICPGQCADLTATAVGGVAPYTVTWGDAGAGATIHVCPSATTTYAATVTDSAGQQGEFARPNGTAAASAAVTVGSTCAAPAPDSGAPSSQAKVLCSASFPGNTGSNSFDGENGELATDAAGNIYVAMTLLGSITIAGQTYSAPNASTLVVKLDSMCNVQWTRLFATSGATVNLGGIAVDGAGNPILAGSFDGTVDLGTGSMTSPATGSNALLVKLDPTGATTWIESYAPSGLWANAWFTGVAAASNGDIAVAVSVDGTVDLGGGAIGGTLISPLMSVVAKLHGDGSFVFQQLTATWAFNGVAIDSAGNVDTNGIESFSDAGAAETAAITTSFDTSGDLRWQNTLAAPAPVDEWSSTSIALGPGGETASIENWGINAYDLSVDAGGLGTPGTGERVVHATSSTGTTMWTYADPLLDFGWDGYENGTFVTWNGAADNVAVDSAGNTLVAGTFDPALATGALGAVAGAGGFDIYLLRLGPGGALSSTMHWGTPEADLMGTLAVDTAGDPVVSSVSVPVDDALWDGGGADPENVPFTVRVTKLAW
ncbi:MAG TPA: hypothetical protein VHV30_00060 [Polyangiaceae bacterium]|jgi:hypothetical protein|nr:hypothetical protein [Polyangiaceae bacterium]